MCAGRKNTLLIVEGIWRSRELENREKKLTQLYYGGRKAGQTCMTPDFVSIDFILYSPSYQQEFSFFFIKFLLIKISFLLLPYRKMSDAAKCSCSFSVNSSFIRRFPSSSSSPAVLWCKKIDGHARSIRIRKKSLHERAQCRKKYNKNVFVLFLKDS